MLTLIEYIDRADLVVFPGYSMVDSGPVLLPLLRFAVVPG